MQLMLLMINWFPSILSPIHKDQYNRPVIFYQSLIGKDSSYLWTQTLKGPNCPSIHLDYPNTIDYEWVEFIHDICFLKKGFYYRNLDGDVDLADWAYWTNLESVTRGLPRQPLWPCPQVEGNENGSDLPE